MAAIIPFVGRGKATQKLALDVFGDSEIFRVPGDLLTSLDPELVNGSLWIDPAVDGLNEPVEENQKSTSGWGPYILSFPGVGKISASEFQQKPDRAIVAEFVTSVLDRINSYSPAWITVPQLPQATGAKRNKINQLLAEATGAWKNKNAPNAKLIAPLIFCRPADYGGVPLRRSRVDQLQKVVALSSATGVWVVDSGMDDIGPDTMKDRYQNLIALHEEIRDRVQPAIHVAGPYWVANLLLFARGIITHPAAAIGATSQYHLSTMWVPPKSEAIKVPIRSLRRKVNATELAPWLTEAIKTLGSEHPVSSEFEELKSRLRTASDWSRGEITKFYRWWFDSIEQAPAEGRAMTLFQDATNAYALGRKLHNLPKTEKAARRPEAIVAPLLTTCL